MEVVITNNILELRRSSGEDSFQSLFDSAPTMMQTFDDQGVLIKVSTFWAAKLGLEPDEMQGLPVTRFLTPASRKYVESIALPQFFETGKMQDIELEFLDTDGNQISVLMSASMLQSESAQGRHALAIMFDNTRHKHTLALLNQKHRAETVGHLVGGVAHDFNNLLSVILGSLESLQDDFDHPERDIFILDAIRATRRGATLTQQLLTYGQQAALRPQVVDLNRLVRNTEVMLKRLFPSQIAVETMITSGLWTTRLDQNLLETVLMSLATNARDAMPDGGTFTVETGNLHISGERAAASSEPIDPGRYVVLSVSDTGCGMTDEIASRIFEPFFSTKLPGAGAGMGLSMIKGFVKQSKGIIRVYTEDGFGTTIKIYFPAIGTTTPYDVFTDRIEKTYATSTDAAAQVLVVEDEDDVRKVVATQLRTLGYRVIEASSGDLAMTLLASGCRPALLLSDVVLPGQLQGPALAAKARKMIDGLRVLYLSGYPTGQENSPISGPASQDTQLMKPISRAQLARAVKAALD